MSRQHGSVLVIVILIMALLAAAIIGLTRNVDIDLFVGRNARILKQSFLWGDSGLEITEKLIDNSAFESGAKDISTDFATNPNYRIDFINPPLYEANGTSIILSENGTTLSSISVALVGRFINSGGSILFENAAEGVGYAAGTGSIVGLTYSLNATGFTDNNQSLKRTAEIYTYYVK